MKNVKPKAIKILILLAAALVLVMSFCGCSAFGDNEDQSPQDVIKDAYGNQQFKISFSSTTLSEPISSLTYTALSIPTIPTPARVGYIFQGWYYDAEYTEPFTRDSLYLKMQDVTLYAKWVSEEFNYSGIYDIKFEIELLEDTVVKGTKTDEYGGFEDFTKHLISSGIYFEKTDDSLYLRIQYDNSYMASADAFSVAMSSQNGSKFKMVPSKSIAVATETVRTVYVDWGDNSLDTPLYLDIGWTNYANESIPENDVISTHTRYTVKLTVSEFEGFSQSYVDLRAGIDDGWYLIPTHYHTESNGETMMSQYQSAEAYLRLEDGRYTLITTFKPYSLLVGNGDKDEYYYNRFMTFAPLQLFYDLNTDLPEGEVSSDWYASTYDAGSYHNMAIEYHADARRYYHILDLGEELKENYMIVNTIIGMAEIFTGGEYGRRNIILSLDLDHILRLNEDEVAYKPLSGDSFEWNDEIVYYPGTIGDFQYTETKYNDMLENGLQDLNVNFFFSASDLTSDYADRTIYSHRIEITPTGAAANMDISESRYQLAYFDLSAQIYGYDGRENLYADSFTTTRISNRGLRETVLIANGKSCSVGEKIDLASIYATYFDASRDFSKVSYKAYKMVDCVIDFTQEITLSKEFTFTEAVAVEFFYADEDGIKSTIFEFAKGISPFFDIGTNNGQTYDPENNTFEVNTHIYAPYITYDWMGGGTVQNYIGGFTAGMNYIDGQYDVSILNYHQTRMTSFGVIDGKYLTGYGASAGENCSFYMPSNDYVLIYEFFNKYGEKYFFEAMYLTSGDNKYVLYEGENEIDSGTLVSGMTGTASIKYTDEVPSLYPDDVMSLFYKDYSAVASGQTYDFYLSSITIKSEQRYYSLALDKYASTEAMIEAAREIIFASEYADIKATYASTRSSVDAVTASGFYNFYFGGKSDFVPLPYETVFTGTTYTLPYLEWQSPSGVVLGKSPSFRVIPVRNGSTQSVGDAASIRTENGVTTVYFNLPGTYRIEMTMYILYDENGNLVFDRQKTQASNIAHAEGTRYSVYYDFEVVDKNSTVTVTLHTTENHPFKEEYGGGTTYTLQCALQDGKVVLPMQDYFETGDAILMGWVRSEEHNARYPNMMAPGYTVANFISSFNSNNIDLYTAWDEMITITLKPSIPIAGFPEEGITAKFYMSKVTDVGNGFYTGFYKVNLDEAFGTKIRTLMMGTSLEFKGYTGGYLEDKMVTNSTKQLTEGFDSDYYVITAVFAQSYKIKFDLKATDADGNRFTTEYYAYGQAYSGENITLPSGKNGTPTCKLEGYEFKYWAVDKNCDGVLSEDEKIPFDIATDVVTDDMADNFGFITLIAVFGEIEE